MNAPDNVTEAIDVLTEEMAELCRQAELGRVSTGLHMQQCQAVKQTIVDAFSDVRPMKPSERKGAK